MISGRVQETVALWVNVIEEYAFWLIDVEGLSLSRVGGGFAAFRGSCDYR